MIRAVVDYVRSLQTTEDVTALGSQIFGSDTDHRVKKLKVGVYRGIHFSKCYGYGGGDLK